MFEKQALGLDIADHTLEAIELRRSVFSHIPTVVNRARMSLEKGVVEHGRLINKKKLLEALSLLWQSASGQPLSMHDIVVGIPERQVYTFVARFEVSTPAALNEQIRDTALSTIPIEKDDLIYSSKIISKKDTAVDVLIYGMSREVLQEWKDFFDTTPYRVAAFDHELLAITRGLFGSQPHEPLCIVDCGAERTKIAICSSRGLEYIHSLEIGGDFFTEQIAKSLDVTKEEADRIKREEGLEPISRRALFEKLLQPIIDEILTACSYYEVGMNATITKILIVGGSARLVGLPEYLQEKTQRTVQRGASFLEPNHNADTTDHLHYIEALGLALKGVRLGFWEREHPSFRL
ncbi:MAG: pilus assembly protein PilM [Patescibacteria group bacterium]